MAISKYRLETFTDGVIAIIITIMVLSIPLPETFEAKDLLLFTTSLIIYLLSFLVVGAFWNQHHRAFIYLEHVNQKIIAANIFFLFFLSLIPLFTKWVIENQGSLLPVIGYDTIYLSVSFCYILMFRLIMEESEHDGIKKFAEKIKSKRESRSGSSWLSLIILLVVVMIVIALSIYLPKVAVVILMGIPILSSIFNLFITDRNRKGSENKRSQHSEEA